MLEMKDFFSVIAKRQNVQRIISIAFSPDSNTSSKNAALAVLI